MGSGSRPATSSSGGRKRDDGSLWPRNERASGRVDDDAAVGKLDARRVTVQAADFGLQSTDILLQIGNVLGRIRSGGVLHAWVIRQVRGPLQTD